MDIVTKLIAKPAMEIQKVATVVAITLGIFVLYSLARITWHVLTPAVEYQPWQLPKIQMGSNTPSAIDFSSYHWFGRAGEQAAPVQIKQPVNDAPKTRLNLVLTGVVASDEPSRSMAIIQYQSKQETYMIDQKIASTRASVVEIYSDRVILNNNGKHETLMLDGFDYKKSTPISQSGPVRQPANKSLNRNLLKTRNEILANPKKLFDFISITPVKTKGKLQGYRLNAGRDPKLFHQSGLKPGDLAVSINGFDLTDIAQSMQVMNELRTMNNIMITIERDGQLNDIQFTLPE